MKMTIVSPSSLRAPSDADLASVGREEERRLDEVGGRGMVADAVALVEEAYATAAVHEQDAALLGGVALGGAVRLPGCERARGVDDRARAERSPRGAD